MNIIEQKLWKIIKEGSYSSGGGTGLTDIGDAWPDGLYTKRGERKYIGPASLTRGMIQVDFPASDNIYGGPDSQNNERRAKRDAGKLYKYLSDPDGHSEIKSEELRDDTPPLSPKQRMYGIHGFHRKQEYTIPPESANFHSTSETLVKPTTPPEGSESGGIPATPEPGSKEMGSASGYRQAQKGGESIFAGNKKLWGKWEDHRIGSKVDGREWKGGKLVDLLPKGAK